MVASENRQITILARPICRAPAREDAGGNRGRLPTLALRERYHARSAWGFGSDAPGCGERSWDRRVSGHRHFRPAFAFRDRRASGPPAAAHYRVTARMREL